MVFTKFFIRLSIETLSEEIKPLFSCLKHWFKNSSLTINWIFFTIAQAVVNCRKAVEKFEFGFRQKTLTIELAAFSTYHTTPLACANIKKIQLEDPSTDTNASNSLIEEAKPIITEMSKKYKIWLFWTVKVSTQSSIIFLLSNSAHATRCHFC